MRRGHALLAGGVCVCLTAIVWLLIPTAFTPRPVLEASLFRISIEAGDAATLASTRNLELADTERLARELEDYPSSSQQFDEAAKRNVASALSLARSEDLTATTASNLLQEKKSEVIKRIDRYEMLLPILRFSTVLAGSFITILLMIGPIIRRNGVVVPAGRLMLGADRAAEVGSYIYEIRATSNHLPLRRRWIHYLSLPKLCCYSAFRYWTDPIRLFVHDRLLGLRIDE